VTAGTTHSAGAAAACREDARAAVVAAELAFPDWSATPPRERSRLLERASELLIERQREIATLVTEETNGTFGCGMFNVKRSADMLAYYAGETDAPAEEQELPSHIPGKRARPSTVIPTGNSATIEADGGAP
jgi:acyl-CoA reductase-like NAD-dependent aldehyde dehydrogenase